MRQLAVLQVEQQQEQWAALHAELAAACPACRVTAEQLTWALECVFSRAFSGPYSGSPCPGCRGSLEQPHLISTHQHPSRGLPCMHPLCSPDLCKWTRLLTSMTKNPRLHQMHPTLT